MAVADMKNSQLRLVLHDGNDPVSGDPIYKAKSFNNVIIGYVNSSVIAL